MRATEELIDRIVNSALIPPGRRRQEIRRELRSHIEEFVVAAREAGSDPGEIEQRVLAHFGDPSQITAGFAWVYRHERRRLRAFAFTLSTVVLASALSAAVLALQAGLAFGFGRPIMHVLAGPHTVIETLDILASVAVYLGLISLEGLFHGHRFQKATLLLTVMLALLMASGAAAGWRMSFVLYGLVNGVFFRAVRLYVPPTPARVGIVLSCFALAGLVSALLRSASPMTLAATCASWLAMGVGYQLMALFAERVDTALLSGLQRIQEGY